MRHLTTTLFIASLVLVTFSGCEERQNMRVAPNRDGHAWIDPARKPPIGNKAVADPETEVYYTVKPGDTLYSIAAAHKMKSEDLIRRNEITDTKLVAGSQIIVNKK